ELRGIRGILADRMTVSRRTIPDASCGLAVDASRLLAIRSRLQDDEPDRSADVTPFTMILAATVQALHRWPMLNATLDEANRTIHLLDDIHLGIATATEHGLMVPVLHDAHRCSLADMAAETRRLAAGARDRSLAPSELMGSTFTVSNFGAFGVDDGVPVINHPEAAILGIGAIAPRPWVANDALSVRSAVTLTVAFDHRVCDGAEAAGFLRTLGDLIENAELDLDSPLLAR
ncbi:MAG: 2-oxo acid dehydrogenase subunit E2, partial [Acidimicrobiia bacterium]|nr:2-oxo acid dehydrogenase subunit E2 [Acidimicrobiia bacterium]